MNNNFIEKFKAGNYSIGSFDAYQDLSKGLIQKNSDLTEEEVDEIMKSMPTTYRASIVDHNGNYIGFIGLYNVDAKNNRTSIRFETNVDLLTTDKNTILEEYKKWLSESLNLNEIEEEIYFTSTKKEVSQNRIQPKTNIIIPSSMLESGISEETLEYFSHDYSIPRMQMPFTIKSNDRAIGIIGLTNLIWSNKRANLNIFLDKSLGDDIVKELAGYVIDDYVNYVHNCNIHNVTLSVSGSDKNKLDILRNTNMNYYGFIPFGSINENHVESNMMFQHIPNMKKQNGVYVPENISKDVKTFDTDKKELDSVIELNNGYRLVSPKILEQDHIYSNKIIDEHTSAMQEREGFEIPLGEDKYILQRGNGNYGISKAVMNYDYVLLDSSNHYAGYINILRNNANNRNAEIEIGIDPKLQHNGLGTQVINKFYDQLFSVGYASVTSAVFEFNNPSIKLHEKVAELNGIRLESYYINGKLWDMQFYTKVNENIDEMKSTRL